MIYMFLSNNPSSGDINSSNLSCLPLKSLVLLVQGACHPTKCKVINDMKLFQTVYQQYTFTNF